MKLEELQAIALPKWPAMTVVGKSVTKDQAAEILIRTNCFYYDCNNQDWNQKVYALLGVLDAYLHKYDRDNLNKGILFYNQLDKAVKELGILQLDYLWNNRIMSSWIFGAKGWCDWNGNIFCNNFNIGKWPNTHDVAKEWSYIAEAFPYLDLKCQLFNGETCEEGIAPLIEYIIKDGHVTFERPIQELIRIHDNDIEDCVLINSDLEVGCTYDKLKWALELTKEKLRNR